MEESCILHKTTYEELPIEEQELLDKAHGAALVAFAPYSDFRVGAAARLSNGKIVIGSNQENIAYPSGLCGERVAMFTAGAQFPNEHVVALATVSPSPIADSQGFAPCGSCRQVVLESELRQSKPIKMLFQVRDEHILISDSAQNLMPFSFRVKDDGLKRNRS
tara:strand:- start:390 stop:878 length:489 start_codon:yes stop_codon:yes gene_type:complete